MMLDTIKDFLGCTLSQGKSKFSATRSSQNFQGKFSTSKMKRKLFKIFRICIINNLHTYFSVLVYYDNMICMYDIIQYFVKKSINTSVGPICP